MEKYTLKLTSEEAGELQNILHARMYSLKRMSTIPLVEQRLEEAKNLLAKVGEVIVQIDGLGESEEEEPCEYGSSFTKLIDAFGAAGLEEHIRNCDECSQKWPEK